MSFLPEHNRVLGQILPGGDGDPKIRIIQIVASPDGKSLVAIERCGHGVIIPRGENIPSESVMKCLPGMEEYLIGDAS